MTDKDHNTQETINQTLTCPMEYAMNQIAGKWKLVILWHIYQNEILRYGQLQKILKKISHKMLSTQLKELVNDGILHKEIYQQIPPKVEYSLTDLGKSLIPVMDMLYDWGQAHRSKA